MNTLVKNLVVSVMATALVVAPLSISQGQNNAGSKPAIVVSIASIDEQFKDVEYLMGAAGQADAVPFVTLMAGAYVEGFDKSKPLGGFLDFKGPQPHFVAFLPVSNLDAILERVAQFTGEPEDAGNDVLRISSPDGKDVFIKQQGGWVFVARDMMDFAALPEDPSRVLGDLPQNYNVAFQLNAQSIPQFLKDQAIEAMKEGFAQSLAELEGETDEATREASEKISGNALQTVTELIQQSDQVTVGWSVDSMAKSTHIDFSFTAIEGTKMAKRMAMLKNTRSSYTGFLLPDAAATLNFSSEIMPEDIENTVAMLKLMRQKALEEIDKDTDLDNDQLPRAKKVVGDLFEILEGTIQSGKMDGGGAVVLTPNAMTVAVGGYVADGARVDQLLKEVAELAKDEPEFPGVQFNAESYAQVNFHTLKFPVPQDEPEARRLLGEQLDVAIGVGPQSFYLAFGKESLSTLKSAIDRSMKNAKQVVPPAQFNIALTPIIKYAASVSEDETVRSLAEQMQQVMGNDRIAITSQSIENGRGSTSRILLEEGVLQALGVAAKAAQDFFGGGGGRDF